MSFKNWEGAVIDWVNCLRLTTPIKGLNELKDGLFFSNLIKLLSPLETTECCTLESILKFLGVQYPKFSFQNENNSDLENIGELDLLAISSLLLHYSCVLDRRDVLTSPLCHRLSRSTQISIRVYLESVKNQITREEFFQLIEEGVSQNVLKKHSQLYTFQSEKTSPSCGSPLQDLLQTPPLKLFRLNKKDREINRLLSEIDTERFEKTELQDELKIQQERNKKLAKQMASKTVEIEKLRGEIVNLESKSVLACQETESYELQRRLRSEIDSLEKYVGQLQNEQCELYNDRDTIKERLRKAEGQCTIWHEKVISSEENFDDLLEKYRQQETEFNNLQSHCNELSALLEEFRLIKNPLESNIEVDTSVSIDNGHKILESFSTEDLACTVVEVQLKDALKENSDLKNTLKDCQINIKQINDELISVKAKYSQLQTDYECIKSDNDELLEKVAILLRTQEALNNTRRELECSESKLFEVSQQNSILNSDIVKLRDQMKETEATLESSKSSNSALINDLQKLQADYAQLQKEFDNKMESCYTAEEKINTITVEYDKLLEKYNNTDFNLSSLQINFDKLENEMEQTLQKLEVFAFGSNELDVKDTNVAFIKIFEQLENMHLSQLEENKTLGKTISCYEELVSKLQRNLNALQERETVTQQEKQALGDCLKVLEEKNSGFGKAITDYEEKISNLNCTISEISKVIVECENLKEIVEKKQNTISELEASEESLEMKLCESNDKITQYEFAQKDSQECIDNLEHDKNSLQQKLTKSEERLSEKQKIIEALDQVINELRVSVNNLEHKNGEISKELVKTREDSENVIADMKTNEDALTRALIKSETEYLEYVEILNTERQNYSLKVHHLESDLDNCRAHCKAIQEDLTSVLKTKEKLEIKAEELRNDSQTHIDFLNDAISKLKSDIEVMLSKETDLKKELVEKHEECSNLKKEHAKFISKYSEVEDQLKNLQKELALKEEQCQEKHDCLSKASQDLLAIKLDVQEKDALLKYLQGEITERTVLVNDLETQISLLNKEKEEQSDIVEDLRKTCSDFKETVEVLENNCSEFQGSLSKVISELSSKNEQFNIKIEEYRQHKEKTENEIMSLTDALARNQTAFEVLTELKKTEETKYKKQIEILQGEILRLHETVESLNKQEVQYIEEIRIIKDELSDTVAKYTEALQIRQEMKAENEAQVNNLTTDLHQLIEKYNALDKTHRETCEEFQNVQRRLEMLETMKIEMEVKVIEEKMKYEEDCNVCMNKLHLQIKELQEKESKFLIEKADLKQEIQTSEETKHDLSIKLKQICDELTNLKEEKELLHQNLSKVQIANQELKCAYDSMKEVQMKFFEENCETMKQLQNDLLHHIGILINEKTALEGAINVLQENISTLNDEQEQLKVFYVQLLQKKDEKIKTLETGCDMFQRQIIAAEEEKVKLEEQIASEQEKYEAYRTQSDKNTEVDKIKIQELQTILMNLKATRDTLELRNETYTEQVCSLTEKLSELENSKLSEEKKHIEDLNVKQEEIEDLNAKLRLLQSQIIDNKTKGDEMTLELCKVTETLRSLTQQNKILEQTLEKEKECSTHKLLEVHMELGEKQMLVQSLQLENQRISQEISLTKKEIDEVREKVRNNSIERNTLELEIKALKEKILTKDSVIRRYECVISETNEKLMSKVEEVFELEKSKRTSQERIEELSKELDRTRKNRDDILESQAKVIKETENNLIRAHENAIEVKNDLFKRIDLAENEKLNERQLRDKLEKILESEKSARDGLELRVMQLTNEKSRISQLFLSLKHNVQKLVSILNEKPIEFSIDGALEDLDLSSVEYLNENIAEVEDKIIKIMKQNSRLVDEMSGLEQEKTKITLRLEQLSNEKEAVTKAKEELFTNYNTLCSEKLEQEQDIQEFTKIQMDYNILKAKYEQLTECSKNNEGAKELNRELQEKITCLEKKSSETVGVCKQFATDLVTHKTFIERLISERTGLETMFNGLKQNLASLHVKVLYVSDERGHAKFTEQLQKFDIIVHDIQKQLMRISKRINEIILNAIQTSAEICDNVYSEKCVSGAVFDRINFDNEHETILSCKDRANNLLEEMTVFDAAIGMKITKMDKENILRHSNSVNVTVKDDELKKRNTALKQRLILAEHAKNTLEKKIEQLRQVNKANSIKSDSSNTSIQLTEEYQKVVSDWKMKYSDLSQEFENYKANNRTVLEQMKNEEIIKLRDAYGKVLKDNTKLDLEIITVRNVLDDRTSQLNELVLIKEAYEKLLEENNKLRMELDTIAYKRSRDRELLLEVQRRDRHENQRIQDIRKEYEVKLEKMKAKMIQLYKEEYNKELQKYQKYQNENILLLKTIEKLKQTIRDLHIECDISADMKQQPRLPNECGDFVSRDSSVTKRKENQVDHGLEESLQNKPFLMHRKPFADDKKSATLPRTSSMNVIEENQIFKHNTLSSVPHPINQNLEMEDEEEELFNDKYLADLKDGRCILPSGRESNASRLSELKYRNSLCPPHLKSSYPAETQFSSPGLFKEEDIKTGTLDDSMSTRLIPGEKPRKKDIGTTSYKKPGPPTPSKNGGRMSLQGNEPHPRDVHESKTPKRMTPSRLRALFMGRNSSTRDNSESVSTGTPRSKRLSIFRKPK